MPVSQPLMAGTRNPANLSSTAIPVQSMNPAAPRADIGSKAAVASSKPDAGNAPSGVDANGMNPMLAQALAQIRGAKSNAAEPQVSSVPSEPTLPSVDAPVGLSGGLSDGLSLEEQLNIINENNQLKERLSTLSKQLYGGNNEIYNPAR